MDNLISLFVPFLVHLTRFVLLAGIPFLILYLLFPKKFTRLKIQRRNSRAKDWLRELRHSLQSILVFTAVSLIVIFSPLREYFRIYQDLDTYPLWWFFLSILIAVVIQDTYFYWMHRTIHHRKLFKWFHVVHHRSTNPTPLTSHAFDVSEAFLEALVVPLTLCFVPMHPLAILLFTASALVVNVYGHLGYEIAPRWFRHSLLFEVLNTSVHHNLHHEAFKGNYGYYFRVWDRLMGTEHPEYVKRYDQIQANRFGEVSPALAKEPA